MRLKRAIVEVSPDDEVFVRNGLGVAVSGEIPLSSAFGVQIGLGRSYLGLDRVAVANAIHRDAVDTTDVGSVDLWQLNAGIVRHVVTGRRLCGYVAASAGLYRFSYAGYRSRVGGIAGTLGFEIPSSAAVGVLLELQLAAAENGSRAPLAAETVLLLNASAGVRFRF